MLRGEWRQHPGGGESLTATRHGSGKGMSDARSRSLSPEQGASPVAGIERLPAGKDPRSYFVHLSGEIGSKGREVPPSQPRLSPSSCPVRFCLAGRARHPRLTGAQEAGRPLHLRRRDPSLQGRCSRRGGRHARGGHGRCGQRPRAGPAVRLRLPAVSGVGRMADVFLFSSLQIEIK